MSRNLSEVIESIGKQGGIALSTGYKVEFDFSRQSGLQSKLRECLPVNARFDEAGFLSMACSEAQLPSVSSQTGTTQGYWTGEGQVNFANGRIFTDTSLGWYCDKNMSPMRFIQTWHDYIYYDIGNDFVGPYGTVKPVRKNNTRVRYPDDYQAIIKITKIDQSVKDFFLDDFRIDTPSLTYTLVNAFPYSIDATPLSYGTSQLVNVSANFYFSKYYVSYQKDPIKPSYSSRPNTGTETGVGRNDQLRNNAIT